jgi:hypothetical protein
MLNGKEGSNISSHIRRNSRGIQSFPVVMMIILAYIYLYADIFMYICICISINVCKYTDTYKFTYLYICKLMHICICIPSHQLLTHTALSEGRLSDDNKDDNDDDLYLSRLD